MKALLTGLLQCSALVSWSSALLSKTANTFANEDSFKLYPLVIVPGVGGSQLQSMHTGPTEPGYCPREETWQSAWVAVKYFVPGLINCLVDDLSMVYNGTIDEYHNQPKRKVRVPGEFGDTKPIEYLDDTFPVEEFAIYFHPFVEYFVENFGYKRNKSIFAAAYDWRLSPWRTNLFEKLAQLVEKAYRMNNGTPVALVGHSMGCAITLAFLNYVTEAWKARHVRVFFSLEGPWLGAPKAAKALISGDKFSTPARAASLQKMEITFESTLYMLPDPNNWPKGNRELINVEDPVRSYSVDDYVMLLRDLNVSDPVQRLAYLKEKQQNLVAPAVETHCIYGLDLPTPYGYVYKTLFDSSPTAKFTGNGDGTVPIHSLEFCKQWRSQQSQPVVLKGFTGLEHFHSSQSKDVFHYLAETLHSL